MKRLKKKWFWILVPLALVLGYITRDRITQPISNTAPVATTTSIPQRVDTNVLSLSIFPLTIRQGDPAEIIINGVKDAASVKLLTYKGKSFGVFDYNGHPTAFVGIDLKERAGSYPLVLTLKDGRTFKESLVGSRSIAEAPLGIPDALGGNTPAGEANLIKTLAKDNATLAALPTTDKMLWNDKFIFPVLNPVVTDTYGYTRLTGASTISHKGTDFHAPPGTKVFATNSGTVSLARLMTAYGNTVVIDHGLGLETMYMHLSELDVKEGDKVEKGELLGLSGQTGYAEGPHLHLSVRINGVSIDPEKFLAFFK